MVIEVSPNRQGVINDLINLFRNNESKWIGGEIEFFVNNFSFKFKPDTIVVSDITAEGLQAVKYETIKGNRTYWKGLGTVYIWGNVADVFPSLTREEVVGIVESGRDYILFYAVLVFTCVMGITKLLNQIRKYPRRSFRGVLIGLLYITLVIILIISISRCFTIYGEIVEFEYSGKLGKGVQKFMSAWHSSCFVRWITNESFDLVCRILVYIFFSEDMKRFSA